MIDNFPPGFVMVLGALLIPFLPHIIKQIYMMILILISAYGLTLGFGIHSVINIMEFDFILFQADKLTFPFAIIFHISNLSSINERALFKISIASSLKLFFE